jgi:hypothetical protein
MRNCEDSFIDIDVDGILKAKDVSVLSVKYQTRARMLVAYFGVRDA